jgi:hypothetical protein
LAGSDSNKNLFLSTVPLRSEENAENAVLVCSLVDEFEIAASWESPKERQNNEA